MDDIPPSNQTGVAGLAGSEPGSDSAPSNEMADSQSGSASELIPPWIESPAETGSEEEPFSQAGEGEKESPLPEGKITKSIFSKIIPLLAIILLGFGLYYLITKVVIPFVNKQQGKTTQKQEAEEEISLTYWGLWESEELMAGVIEEYLKSHPNIKINYLQQSHQDYRERLQSALARGEGPDIFRFHHTWVPMLKRELAPAPEETKAQVNLDDYFPIIKDSLESNSQLIGLPLGFDTLALYYNPKIFEEAGKTFPSTWDELRRTAIDLTIYDEAGRIQLSGAALGSANNVDHFSDILGLMMLQNGVDLKNPSGVLAEDALKFYTLFQTTDRVWNETLPNSVYAFATEKTAMMVAPSWRAHEIRQTNPNLEFKTAPVPQLPGEKIAWASFWAEGVSNKSQNIAAAWEFLAYLSSKDALLSLYSKASQTRKFGEPYPRKDLAANLLDDPVVGAFLSQGEYAQSFYLCSNTYDNGINDKIINYFKDAVNKVVRGENPTTALNSTAQGVGQILSQYEEQ
ncbi:hypothetical protein COT75_00985 [Candidatus Beckwithbacteria bacterium CG10_big_fil_rev_8_21_14_0_10_34_10]|uniref:Sugar ABC transporter substrate-binding protein n=1 Tax=Candidatus Beckwithbacteria bacterium CG10_big_fil_rev_8_21_14_0_10_34_10 TaxID=1974495 RepID=A0A2H0WA43_9BACT|nr:MAG: hypothetical protein COT75_00985 [Candidatus Beckwithbacteria bacterium CG10_big_fil_rev_8_21_14_0_10_34_10]